MKNKFLLLVFLGLIQGGQIFAQDEMGSNMGSNLEDESASKHINLPPPPTIRF